jgi:hypothetical protein
MSTIPPKDLVVLTADQSTQLALRELLSARRQALAIREILFDVWTIGAGCDSACARQAPEFLRNYQDQFGHALVVFDHEGSGMEKFAVGEVESGVADRLRRTGWDGRAAVVVIEPELEAWVWSDSPNVEMVLGWSGRDPGLRKWLVQKGFLDDPKSKPARPKEALEAALGEVDTHSSSALFRQLAGSVGLDRCQDAAFTRLKKVLHGWFGS